MAVIDVIREAATVFGLTVPDAVFSQQSRDSVELQALANEMAQRIALNAGDWSKLKSLCTLTGNGARSSFPLPSDYARMLKKADLWQSSNPFNKLIHYPETDHWLGMLEQNFQQTVGGWTIIGEEIHIRPIVPAGATVRFYYITNNIIKAADGSLRTRFLADTDTFRLNERVLKLGMIWQRKASKGQAYAEDMATYEEALAYDAGNDRGSNLLTVGSKRLSADSIAFPGVVGR